MAKKYNDFDEADQDGVFDQIFGIISEHRRTFAVVSVAVAVVVLGLIVWDGSSDNADIAAGESVPIVRAESGDYKTTPENPGGMEVPYRDSTVFSSDETPKDGGTENILADESVEEPVSRSQAFAGLNTEGDQPGGAPTVAPSEETIASEPTGEVEAVEQTLPKAEPVEMPSHDALVSEAIGTTDSSPEKTAAVTTETIAPAVEEKPAPVVEEKEEKKAAIVEPAAGTTAAKITPGGYFVQLASVKDSSRAAAEYKKMQAKFTGLQGVDFRSQQADLGAKGTFYRIQAGPMSKDSASSLCGSIKSGGGSCLVVAK